MYGLIEKKQVYGKLNNIDKKLKDEINFVEYDSNKNINEFNEDLQKRESAKIMRNANPNQFDSQIGI